MSASYIQKFMFEHLPVKGAIVVLDDCWQEVANQQEYPAGLRQLLGELMAANALLTGNLKLIGKVICQVQNNPHFKIVVSECNNELSMRATAKFDHEESALADYQSLLRNGRLVVSIDSKNEGNLYQSIIAFTGNDLSSILNNYMAQSEQLKSWFLLAYSPTRVVGFLLQQLPDVHHQFTQEIERVFMLANTLTPRELLHDGAEVMLHKLFNEDNLILRPEQMLQFNCSCSRERVSEILRGLGKEEINTLIIEQGNIIVDCDYCNASYSFTSDELNQIALLLVLQDSEAISNKIN